MEIKVQKWGNNLAIRIPNMLALDFDLDEETIFNISKDNDRIILKPIPKKEKIKELLTKVEEKNTHKEIRLEGRAGNEIW